MIFNIFNKIITYYIISNTLIIIIIFIGQKKNTVSISNQWLYI